jgi:CRP-like cAMP-binding protein
MERSRVAAIPLFADLPEDEIAAIASVASEVEIPSGQKLAGEGRIGHSLFVIESGTADVVIEGATVRTIGRGDVVGEIAVLPPRLTRSRRRRWRKAARAQPRSLRPRRCD